MSQNGIYKFSLQVLALILALSTHAFAGAWQYQAPFKPLNNNTNSTSSPGSPDSGLFGRVTIAPVPYVYKPAYPPKSSTNWIPFAMMGAALLPMVFSDTPAGGSAQPQAARTKYQLAKDAPAVASEHRKNSRRAPANIRQANWRKVQFPSQNQYSEDTAR